MTAQRGGEDPPITISRALIGHRDHGFVSYWLVAVHARVVKIIHVPGPLTDAIARQFAYCLGF